MYSLKLAILKHFSLLFCIGITFLWILSERSLIALNASINFLSTEIPCLLCLLMGDFRSVTTATEVLQF